MKYNINLLTETEVRPHNNFYPKGWFSYSKDSFVVNGNLVFRMKFSVKNPVFWVLAIR